MRLFAGVIILILLLLFLTAAAERFWRLPDNTLFVLFAAILLSFLAFLAYGRKK